MAAALKKVTVNLPDDLLERAQQLTGKGITDTLVAGLRELERESRLSALRGLKGKVRFNLDLERTRR